MTRTERVLIVDDDALVAKSYDSILDASGWQNRIMVTDSREVMGVVRGTRLGAILLDLKMPHISGQELLLQIVAEHPEVPVIVLTLEDSVDVAVECMRVGAFDFMTKPVDPNRLINSVTHAVNVRSLDDEVRVLASRGHGAHPEHPEVFGTIITRNESMLQLFAYIETIAPSPRAVLITGESGTGKELLARAVHDASGRAGQFVPVNVAGLDETVFSDTLFGHRRGAFTGADSNRKGLVEQAACGTLFLDEIGDLDNAAQVKLLRLLQEEEYYPLGSDAAERSTARVVAATNADLEERQESGAFRRDLFYRLMAHHVEIPPLRERTEDLQMLLSHFFDDTSATLGKPSVAVPHGLSAALRSYDFPGNVRELQSLVFDVVSRAAGQPITVERFLDHPLLRKGGVTAGGASRITYQGAIPTLDEAEEFFISEALAKAGGNQTAAARMLGVSQSTLSRRLARDRVEP